MFIRTGSYFNAKKKEKKVSGFWSLVGFKISAVTHFFWGANREIRDACIRDDQMSHIQSMVANRGLTNWPNVHTPM